MLMDMEIDSADPQYYIITSSEVNNDLSDSVMHD